jgi:hypothetical protein
MRHTASEIKINKLGFKINGCLGSHVEGCCNIMEMWSGRTRLWKLKTANPWRDKANIKKKKKKINMTEKKKKKNSVAKCNTLPFRKETQIWIKIQRIQTLVFNRITLSKPAVFIIPCWHHPLNKFKDIPANYNYYYLSSNDTTGPLLIIFRIRVWISVRTPAMVL